MLESTLIASSVAGTSVYCYKLPEDMEVKKEQEKAKRKEKEAAKAKKEKKEKTEEEKREWREKYRGRANSLLTVGATSTTTLVIENSISASHKQQMYERYSQAYIESMSDEELVQALEKMNLLETEEQTKQKTI